MLPNRRNKLTPEQKVQLVSDYRAGLPIKVIAERYRVHPATVHRIIKLTPDEIVNGICGHTRTNRVSSDVPDYYQCIRCGKQFSESEISDLHSKLYKGF